MHDSKSPEFRIPIAALVLFHVAALFVRSLIDVSLRRGGVDAGVAGDLSYLAIPPILALLLFPWLRRARGSLAALLDVRRLTPMFVLRALALGVTLRVTYWAALTLLIGTGTIRDDDPAAIRGPLLGFDCPPAPELLLGLAVTAAVVPAVEEIVHRGLLLFGLLRHGPFAAVAGSALYFAVLHETGTVPAAFAAGIVLAIRTLHERSLWGPLIAHGAYNAAAILDWDCLTLVWNPVPGDPAIEALTWLSMPVLIAGTLVSLRLAGSRFPGFEKTGARLRTPRPAAPPTERSRRAR